MSARDNGLPSNDKWIWWIVGLVAIGLLVAIWAVVKQSTTSTSTTTNTQAPAALVAKVNSVSAALFASVGVGSANGLPKSITAPALTKNGKPWVLYVGAEYCPYCATQRWPTVVALSRFGSFKGLGLTHSASADVFPDTQTFSFHGATYTSQYLAFDGVETMGNEPQVGGYAKLDTLTSDEQAVLDTYDAAPFVAAASAGSIPFIDFGGRYLLNGSTYDTQLLQGKTADQIASVLTNASDPITKGIIGSANVITAAICTLTNNQPESVCATPGIQALQTQLNAQKPISK